METFAVHLVHFIEDGSVEPDLLQELQTLFNQVGVSLLLPGEDPKSGSVVGPFLESTSVGPLDFGLAPRNQSEALFFVVIQHPLRFINSKELKNL